MKKLLGLTLVLALAIPASADVLKNVNLIGEIQTIASDVNHNTPGNYYNDRVHTRVLAGLSAQLVEDVTANILFQYVTPWDGNMNGDTVQQYEDNVEVANANVVLSNLFDCLEATVGRQFYGDEDSAVMYVGPNHYNAETFNRASQGYAMSLDAVKLTYADDAKAFTFIAGKVPGNLNAPANTNGTNVFGADLRLNLGEMIKLQSYIYEFQKINVLNPDGETDKDAGLYGAKLTLNPEAALISVEYARNYGGDRLIKEHHDTGYMLKVDGKMDIEEFAVRGTFLYEHENFYSWGNYTPGLLVGHSLADRVLGRGINLYSIDGVRMFNLGVDVKPFEKWTFSLDGYSFQDRYGHHAATWEGDLTAKYAHNEYVELFAGLGYAKYANTTGMLWKDALHKDNYKWQLGMLINF